MANRFQRVLAPIDYSDVQMYNPNIEALNAAMSAQQGRFDQARNLANSSFKALPGADSDRRAEILKQQQDSIDTIATEFSRDIDRGNQAIDDFTLEMKRSYSPGGEAYQINSQVELYQSYASQVDQMVKDGKITNAEKSQWLKSKSLERFGGTNFDSSTGTYSSFSGISPAADIDLTKENMELVEGWKMTALERPVMKNGQPVLDQDGNPVMEYDPGSWSKDPRGYYHVRTGETVPFDDLYNYLIDYMSDSPRHISYLKQEVDMQNLQGQDALDHISRIMHNSARMAADKESRTIFDDKYLRNWQQEEATRFSNEMKLRQYQFQLENPVDNFYTVSQGQEFRPQSGTSLSEVRQYREQGEKLQIQGLQELTDRGFDQVVAAYNADNPNNEINTGDPLDMYRAYKRGDFDKYMDKTIYSDEILSQDFAQIGEGLRQSSIADARISKLENEFNSRLTDDDQNLVRGYDVAQKELASALINTTPELSQFTEEEIVQISEGYLEKDGKIYSLEASDVNGVNISVTQSQGEGNNLGVAKADYGKEFISIDADIAKQMRSTYSNMQDLIDRRNDFINEGLDVTIKKDVTTTNVVNPSASYEMNQATINTLKSQLEDPVNLQRAIITAGNLSSDQKEDLQEELLEEGQEAKVKNVNITSGPIDGRSYWEVSVERTVRDGSKTKREPITLYVPVNTFMTDNTAAHVMSEESRVNNQVSRIFDNNISGEYVDPEYENIVWNFNKEGEALVQNRNNGRSKVVPRSKASEYLIAELETQNRVRQAGVDRAFYDTKFLANLKKMTDTYGNNITATQAKALGDMTGLTPQQIGILLYDDANAIVSTDKKVTVPPLTELNN